jgi:hypothetical protein
MRGFFAALRMTTETSDDDNRKPVTAKATADFSTAMLTMRL